MKQSINALYDTITQNIITALEAGVRPWTKPWDAGAFGSLPLRHMGIPYQGFNALYLWMVAGEEQYQSPFWMTLKQANILGAKVKKGAQSTLVTYASSFKKTEEAEDGSTEEVSIPFMKPYRVFNADQIEGLPETMYNKPVEHLSEEDRIDTLERFFSSLPVKVRTGGNRAFFNITSDSITMPEFVTFHSPFAYYATLCHELIHWTGHNSRLNREMTGKKNSPEYAFEELVAEIGSCFLAAELGIAPDSFEENAAYIGTWIKALKNDRKYIVKAAVLAQKAVGFVLSKSAL